MVYALGKSAQRLRILGPNNAQKRTLVCVLPACEALEIECDKSVCWSYEYQVVPGRQEEPDQTPVEIMPGQIRPESLQEIMARMIQDRFDEMARDKGMETFEEADDFDMDDELPRTPYEMVDMDPEEPFYPDVNEDRNIQLESKEKVKDNVDSTKKEATDERSGTNEAGVKEPARPDAVGA